MIIRIAYWTVPISRPAEGWFALPLLTAAVGLVVAAVLEVGWVAEDGVVVPAAVAGIVLGGLLARRPLAPLLAWLLLLPYSLLLPTLTLAGLWSWPPLAGGWPAVRLFWLQRGSLFVDRFGSWWVAVFSGGRSAETLVFAYLLGVLAFLLSAITAWSTLRLRRPLLGLTLLGIALAVNSYFGGLSASWAAFYIGITVFLAAVVHFAALEQQWEETAIDYSDEIRVEHAFWTAGMALILVGVAFLLPAFSISDIQEWLQRQTAVNQLEEEFGRAFAGVEQPRRRPSPGGVGGAGTLPRSYLLDAPPELLQTVMMTATVQMQSNGIWGVVEPEVLRNAHWRGLSYDVYTGRGWAISEERLELLSPGETIPFAVEKPQIELRQQIFWIRDERLIRYSLGLPAQFDQEVTVAWRGITDLARVLGDGTRYSVESALPAVSTRQLQQADLANVPPQLLARYTALPETVPPQVLELAREIAADLPSSYDQARALEQFLRQYPYSLMVDGPPEGVDPVAYFLFELQAGYCDYYASAMVVMARSLGLPARLAVGYLAQEPNDLGVQTIRQINGHSWAEIYFAGVGWVEFEPTAAFTSARDYQPSGLGLAESVAATPAPPPPIPPLPESARVRPFPWGRILLLGGLALALTIFWRRQRQRTWKQWQDDPVGFSYGRLQRQIIRLHYPHTPSQTPLEFAADFNQWLPAQRWPRLFHRQLLQLQNGVRQLTGYFVLKQYARRPGPHLRAWNVWRDMRGSFWPFLLWQKIRRR